MNSNILTAISHIIDGKAIRGVMKCHPCNSYQLIYVPIDESIHKVVIVHKKFPHNHPLPNYVKLSHESKNIYNQLIKAHGPWGATVQSIENAPTTTLILEGETPALYDMALMDTHQKKDMIWNAKLKESPSGLDIDGVHQQFLKESQELPVMKRYIQAYHHVGDQIMILIFDSFLLSLIHDSVSFEVDHTFKHVRGYNEWEIIIFCDAVRRDKSS
ncbi:hypothetical protein BDQ17DRAFT_1430663 [Cyathus striatus]|nr:hypothetical protein BDQ17DRAFT_1430663 [Cyathus striatus]